MEEAESQISELKQKTTNRNVVREMKQKRGRGSEQEDNAFTARFRQVFKVYFDIE